MSGKLANRLGALLLALAAASCAEEAPGLELSAPDAQLFEQEVYPVLLRDCGFHACHGSRERFFQVFGPGRGRLLPETMPLDPADPAEIAHSYERARSMLDTRAPESSLLLRKPLATSAGGTGHQGTDQLGRNVYDTRTEPGYLTLSRWATSAPAPTVPSALP
jgi:hypothetical protein